MKYFIPLLWSLVLGAVLFPSLRAQTVDTMDNDTMITQKTKMLRHVVLFQFKEGTTPEELSAIETAFMTLPNKIPEIVEFEWGLNNSPEGLDKGFTHCFFVSFENEEARDIYLPHPEHKAFVEIASPHIEDVLVVDYWKG